jgi:adenylylsulfate kinase-like enzyme
VIIWLFGQPCSGKTTLGHLLLDELKLKGHDPVLVDGDKFREVFNEKTYGREARIKNVEKAMNVAKYLESMGHSVICSFVTPYKSMRYDIKDLIPDVKFVYLYYEGVRGREDYHVKDFEIPSPFEEELLSLDTSKHGEADCLSLIKFKFKI